MTYIKSCLLQTPHDTLVLQYKWTYKGDRCLVSTQIEEKSCLTDFFTLYIPYLVNTDKLIIFKKCLCFRSTRHQWRQDKWQVILPLKMPLLRFPQNSTFGTTSKQLLKMDKFHRLLQPRILLSSEIFHYTEIRQYIIYLAISGLDHYPNFLRTP